MIMIYDYEFNSMVNNEIQRERTKIIYMYVLHREIILNNRIVFKKAWTTAILMMVIILNHLPLTCLSSDIDNSDVAFAQSVRGLPVGI